MSRCRWVAALALGVAGLMWVAPVRGENEVRPDRLYRLDLRVRLPTEKEAGQFREEVKVPVTVFLDRQTGRLLYVGEDSKSLAVVAAGRNVNERGEKAPTWLHGLTLKVRAFDEKEFTAQTRQIGVEVYRDENSGHLLYVSHTGSVAVVPVPKTAPSQRQQAPTWLDRLPMKVRRAIDFGEGMPFCGVEVYRDENTCCLIYAADNGALAVLAQERTGAGKETRKPTWTHALHTPARAFDEETFTGGTRQINTEVYLDENRNVSVYLTETLRLAVLPGGRATGPTLPRDTVPREPLWQSRLRPRDGAAGKWSAELYRNPNNGHLVLLTPQGAVAVLAPRGLEP
jgi:hypothetical protein